MISWNFPSMSDSPSSAKYLRTADIAEQPAIGPAQSSKVHTAVRSCRSDSKVRQRKHKQTKASVTEREIHHEGVFYVGE